MSAPRLRSFCFCFTNAVTFSTMFQFAKRFMANLFSSFISFINDAPLAPSPANFCSTVVIGNQLPVPKW